MLEKVCVWIFVNLVVKQFWDSVGYKIFGGMFVSFNVVQMLVIVLLVLCDKIKGCFLVFEKIMCVVVEGVQVDFDIV